MYQPGSILPRLILDGIEYVLNIKTIVAGQKFSDVLQVISTNSSWPSFGVNVGIYHLVNIPKTMDHHCF